MEQIATNPIELKQLTETVEPTENVFIQRKSFYQRLRTFKYACIIQLLTTTSLFFFVLIDMGFKLIQSESASMLNKMIKNIDEHLLHNCTDRHNVTHVSAD